MREKTDFQHQDLNKKNLPGEVKSGTRQGFISRGRRLQQVPPTPAFLSRSLNA